ncbi:MAG: DNA-binding domain-containing protein [Burkholderiales bacterium]|nr:DNA-binding domain-containing protein [Burkholderiales bacterium]
MADLATIQSVFAEVLRNAAASVDERAVFNSTGESLAERLALYRGNVFANGRKALAAAYPVVEQLVGGEFFDGLAREYGRRSPSSNGDLTVYGERFGEFLDGFEHVRDLPYLPDVARLEWAVHRAHYAADAERLDLIALAAIPVESQGALRPRLHPACALLVSRWPLVRIRAVHQHDHVGDRHVEFDDGPHRCMVYRPEWRVVVGEVGVAGHAFLESALSGAVLDRCVDAALAADASFDLGQALAAWIEARVIVALD